LRHVVRSPDGFSGRHRNKGGSRWLLVALAICCAGGVAVAAGVPAATIATRMLAGTTTGSTRVAAAPATASSSSGNAASCSGLYFISARGSGEPFEGATNMSVSRETDTVLEGIEDELHAEHLTIPIQVDQLGPAYTAPSVNDLLSNLSIQTTIPGIWHQFADVNVPNYIGQEEAGEAELYAYLTGIELDCYPTGHEPMVVLAGYSQGAMVVHNVLNSLVAGDQTGFMSMIKGAVLIADPERTPFSDVPNFGTASPNDYGACHLADDLDLHKCVPPNATTDVAKYFASVTTAICDQGDIVCDTSSLLSLKNASSLGSLRAAISVGEWVHTNCHAYCSSFGPVITAGRGIGRHLVEDVRVDSPSTSPSQTPSSTPASTSGSPGSWTPAKAPLPADVSQTATGAGLNSVACTSSNCVATGYYNDSSGDNKVLIDEGSGASWTAVGVPLPSSGNLSGEGGPYVACATSSACVAVGQYLSTDNGTQGLLVTGSGSSWTATVPPLPANADGSMAQLWSITCPSATSCVAVGDYTTSSGVEGLVLTGLGSSWQAAEAPLPANANTTAPEDALDSVACSSASNCAAVGSYETTSGVKAGWLLTGSGTSWTAAETPLPPNAGSGDSGLLQAACTESQCVATGSYTDSSADNQAMMVTQSGSSWTATETPLPANSSAGGPGIGFVSLACASTSSCTAIGWYETDETANPQGVAIVTGFGSSWTLTEPALPANTVISAAGMEIGAAACPSAASCVVAGSAIAQEVLITGSGSSWTATEVPVPSDNDGADGGVLASACQSASSCVLVGQYSNVAGSQGLILTGSP
jgi:Cutinase